MKADDFLADVPSADDFLGEPEPRKPRRDRIRNPYVAPDNPADPILPTGGSVLQDVQMPVPTFTEDRQNRALVNRAIESNTPAPRAPRPVRDAKGIAQDLYSILGNTGVQLVKPFVDVPNILLGGALDPAVGFLNNASRAANEAASPTTQYDRETLANIPEGQTLEKAATLISNPGLAANMGIPSAASMVMPMAAVKGASLLAPRTALAMGDKFATGTAVGANALMNAGDTFGQTESDIPGRLLAALGSGAASALVGKATGGGLEGQLARGGGVPTVGAALRSVGNESVQEFGENVGNQLAQDTGEGKPLNLAKAIDEGTIGALLAPFVSGPINAAQLATSPERRNASLLAGAINADASSMPARPDVMDNSVRAQPAPVAERPVTPATPAPVPQLPYDPAVQNPQRPVVVDAQGNAREMTADEFLAADEARQGEKDIGLTPDVRRAQEVRSAGEQVDGEYESDRAGAAGESLQSVDDRSLANAQLLSDLTSGESFISKGYDGLDRNARLAVQRYMSTSAQDSEVLNSVVKRIPVDVMNVLSARKLTPEMLFHHPSMLEDLSSRGDSDHAVAGRNAATAIVRIVADNAAESSALGPVRVLPVKDSAAIVTGGGRANFQGGTSAGHAAVDGASDSTGKLGRGLGDRGSAVRTIDNRHVVTPTSDSVLGVDGVLPSSTPPILRGRSNGDQDKIAERPAAAQEDRSGDGAPGQDVARGPQGADAADQGSARGQSAEQGQSEGLTSYTPEELRARDERIAREAKAEATRQAQEEAKAKADKQRGEFTLTGSDRAADSNPDQGDIFSTPAAQQEPAKQETARPPKPPAVQDVVDLRKRLSVLKALKECLT